MSIDFLLDNQPFDKLVSAYIQHEPSNKERSRSEQIKKEITFLNSILVHLTITKKGLSTLLSEIRYCFEVNSDNRDCLRRGAQLITQVIKRSQYILSQTDDDTINSILTLCFSKAFITICGNDFIALIQQITSKIDLTPPTMKQAVISLFNFLTSNKLQINTYRQQTRLSLYKILLKLLNLYPQVLEWRKDQGNQKRFLERCVKAGDGEKDPRNIGSVFQLYLRLFELFPIQQLSPFKSIMFQNIESYYPIEFIGDQDNENHRQVNIQQITSSLDQCLCHSFFAEQTWDLLTTKTAGSPISKFVPTLILYIQTRRKQDNQYLLERFKSLLFRFSQEQFIEEQYEQDCGYDLGTVIQKLLDIIFCRDDQTYNYKRYAIVFSWLEMMVGKVTNGECKHSGTMMGIFRKIVKNSKIQRFSTLVELFRTYSIKTILKILSPQNEIIPKLGLAVIAMAQLNYISDNMNELMGLLALKVGNLYPQVPDEVKLLLLKILLEIYNGSQINRGMVRKVNDSFILKDCLSRAKVAFGSSPNPNQVYLVKAFIDFVAAVYPNQTELILVNIEGVHYELQIYVLTRLWLNLSNNEIEGKQQKKQAILSKLNTLIYQIKQNDEQQSLIKSFKILFGPELVDLILKINWKIRQRPQKIFQILLQLREHTNKYIKSYQPFNQNFTSMQKVIHEFLFGYGNQVSKEEQLWRFYINQNGIITFPSLSNISQYSIQTDLKQESLIAYPPTFIHWNWQQLKNYQNKMKRDLKKAQIIKFLPEKLLLRDSEQILSLLLNDPKLSPSLLKITKNMEVNTIKESGILSYCLQYVSKFENQENDKQRTTEQNVSILAILINLLQRQKKTDIRTLVSKEIKTIKKLILHRKRAIRQAARKLISLIQQ